eukprot:EG_transcript_7568
MLLCDTGFQLHRKGLLQSLLPKVKLCLSLRINTRCLYPLFHIDSPAVWNREWAFAAVLGSRQKHGFTALNSSIDAGTLPCIEVQEHLNRYGIDIQQAVTRYPPLRHYKLERVQRVTSYLEHLGIDVSRVLSAKPALFACDVTGMEERVQFLRSREVDIVKTVNSQAGVFTQRTSKLRQKMDIIGSNGRNATHVVNRFPAVLRASVDILTASYKNEPSAQSGKQKHTSLLRSFGLDADKILSRHPQLSVVSVESMEHRIKYLQNEGIPIKVVNNVAQVLGFRVETIQEKISFLKENGFEPVRHITSIPSFLGFSLDHKCKPILDFVLHDMGRKLAEVDGYPRLWGHSLEHRIKPRGLLKAKGLRRGCSQGPSQFSSSPPHQQISISSSRRGGLRTAKSRIILHNAT